jgi:hypothetical protein
MNWGYKLLLVFAAFGGMISYMVYRCVQTPVNLVSAEYYRDELVYQDVIDGRKKADALSGKVELKQEGSYISIRFPQEIRGSKSDGTIRFYCPSDATKDWKVALSLNPDGTQLVSTKTISPGHYVVKISWETNHSRFYTEEPFIVM